MAEQRIDADQVAQMRAMLAQRGGEEAVRRRFGDAAVDGPEAQAARRQIEASRERQREQRERAAREAEQQDRERRDRAAREAEGAQQRDQSGDTQDRAQGREAGAQDGRPANGRPTGDAAAQLQREAVRERIDAEARAMHRAGAQHVATQEQSRDAVHAM